jgi:hypothetical protein
MPPGFAPRRILSTYSPARRNRSFGVHKRLGHDIKCIGTALERIDGGRDILRSSDFRCDNVKAERAGRCLNFIHLQHADGTDDIGHDCQPAETGDNLAQEVESLAGKIGRLV